MNARRWLIALLVTLTSSMAAADMTGHAATGWLLCGTATVVAWFAAFKWERLDGSGKHDGGDA